MPVVLFCVPVMCGKIFMQYPRKNIFRVTRYDYYTERLKAHKQAKEVR